MLNNHDLFTRAVRSPQRVRVVKGNTIVILVYFEPKKCLRVKLGRAALN